ncbi:GntR family transcriptional regulator [Oceanobacillus halophilus]|uniref:GntR family transcriptional regulator n=1 Tax=Oceanobacillus halophilus TaxID=930130 RepID=A0A495A036_9BACI|nr:GntR family transcriptional regulator [Oceanobacillus halophilus]RKQ32484.1 GntR family transcriptional regulator [Oceanobacillus halophilus]
MRIIPPVIKRENYSTRDFVYETLKKRIIELDLEPGQKISEQEIAKELSVSRTPVREAFLKLSQEDMLGIYPQIGTIVSMIDLDLVEEGRFIRENIEKAVVREACQDFDEEQFFRLESNIVMQELCLNKGSYHQLLELDDEFHRLLFEGCNKLRTWKMIRQMNSHFDRLRVLRLASNLEWDILVSQHKAILNFIQDKKEEDAEKLIVQHLNLVNFEKQELKKKYPNYF